jgi:hypothetical protein
VLALSQLADAAPPKATPGSAGQVAAIELRYVTQVGEGAEGIKVFHRNGCYVGDSVGSPGGAGKAHDRETGCAGAAAMADLFKQADQLAATMPAAAAPAREGRAGGRPRTMAGGREVELTLILAGGARRAASEAGAAATLQRLINNLSFPTWYAEPPKPAVGTGPQLIVLSAHADSTRLQASMTAGGTWWCHRSVMNDGAVPKSPTETPKALNPDEAAAILGRVLKGISPAPEGKGGFTTKKGEISVEAALANGKREPVTSQKDAETAITRFGAEMRKLSASCTPPL